MQTPASAFSEGHQAATLQGSAPARDHRLHAPADKALPFRHRPSPVSHRPANHGIPQGETMYTSIGTGPAIFWLVLFSALFAAAGILYARRWRESLEDFVVARNTQGPIATFATLLASALGAWILFSPPRRPPGAAFPP